MRSSLGTWPAVEPRAESRVPNWHPVVQILSHCKKFCLLQIQPAGNAGPRVGGLRHSVVSTLPAVPSPRHTHQLTVSRYPVTEVGGALIPQPRIRGWLLSSVVTIDGDEGKAPTQQNRAPFATVP